MIAMLLKRQSFRWLPVITPQNKDDILLQFRCANIYLALVYRGCQLKLGTNFHKQIFCKNFITNLLTSDILYLIHFIARLTRSKQLWQNKQDQQDTFKEAKNLYQFAKTFYFSSFLQKHFTFSSFCEIFCFFILLWEFLLFIFLQTIFLEFHV